MNDGDRPQRSDDEPSSVPLDDTRTSGSLGLPTETPVSIGDYRITRKIGEGGMGCVYEAIQENPRRTVAVKVIRGELRSSSGFRRFRRESHALGQLHHPGIAQIFEAGTADALHENGATENIAYFVMELVRGSPLKAHSNEHQLSPQARLALVRRICDAVQHAHDQGVIHRDLKPANILVEEDETDGGGARIGRPKVLDFGVARTANVDLQTVGVETSLDGLVGTVPYMSPEQVSGRSDPVDERTDVYSLGVILYELLAGRLPNEVLGKTMIEAIRIIREEEPIRLSLTDPAFHGDVETIVGKALEKDPRRRYASALELGLDIQRYLDHEPISARPPSAIYHLGKFARRHRGLVGGIVVAFIFLLLGLVGVSWFAVSESRQRQLAQQLAVSEGVLRSQAEEAEKEARREERKARAVNEFLTRMLRESNPLENPLGRDLTLLEALEQVVWDPAQFSEEPEVEAAVHLTAGNAYLELGNYERSEPHLRRALALRLETLGPEHLETAEAQDSLGRWHEQMEEYATAHDLQSRALAVRERRLGDRHPTVADSLNNLAVAFELQGDLAEAESLHRRALAIRREHADDPLAVAISLNNLGVLLENRGEPEKARPFHEEALALRREHLGDDHPRVATSLNNCATLLNRLGEHEEAARLQREAVEIRLEVLGESHPLTVESRNNLGAMYLQLGQLDEAEKILREVVETGTAVLPPARLAAMEGNLAMLLRSRGRGEEAEKLFRSSLARKRAAYDADHPDLAVTLVNLGILLRRTEKEEAVELHTEALRIREKHLGRDHVETQKTIYVLASTLRRARRNEEARDLFAEALQHLPSQLGDDSSIVVDARLGLLLALDGLGDAAGAERLAVEITERGTDRTGTRIALQILIRLTRQQDRREEMKIWQEKLRELDGA